MLVYFTWPAKRPGGHQSQLTIADKILLRKLLTMNVWKWIIVWSGN